MFSRLFQWAAVSFLVSGATAGFITIAPVMAQLEQGNTLILGANPAQNVDVRGYVKGAVALFKTVGDRDIAQRRCMGYGALTPDHTLQIQQKTSQLALQLKTKAQDTTLVVKGPGGIYCADDSPQGGKDAGLVLKNLKAGTYQVWVGAFEPGAGFRYTLNVQAQP